MAKLKELTSTEQVLQEVVEETYSELFSAHRELAELTTLLSDKLGFLCQANRLSDLSVEQNVRLNADLQKWMIAYAWNLGVKCYQQKEGSEKELARRFF